MIEEEDKLFKKQDFICNKVGKLVDCKDLACANQSLFEEQHKLKNEVSSFEKLARFIKELARSFEIEKDNFQELNYVVNFESYFGKQICYWNHVLT